MNKTIVPAFAALAMLAAWPVQAQNCTHHQVVLHIDKNSIRVTPPDPKCVANGGDSFIIRVQRPAGQEDHDITVKQKNGVPLRIDGQNEANRNEVLVTVDGNGDPNEPYGYIIEVHGHGMLDPEVRVVPSTLSMLTSELEQANKVLEEQMGFGVDELIEKQKNYEDLANQAQ